MLGQLGGRHGGGVARGRGVAGVVLGGDEALDPGQVATRRLEPVVQEISFEDFPVLVVNLSADYSLVRLKQEIEGTAQELERITNRYVS